MNLISTHIYIVIMLGLALFIISAIKYETNFYYNKMINMQLLWNYLFIFTFALSIDEIIQLYNSNELMTADTLINSLLIIFIDDIIALIINIVNYFIDKDYQKRDEYYNSIINK